MERDESYADKMLRDAMLFASGGFDAEEAAHAVNAALKATKMQAELLQKECEKLFSGDRQNIDCPTCHRGRLDIDRIAKAMQSSAKMVNEITRLAAFCGQRGDGKEASTGSWLSVLPDDKIEVIKGWVREYSPINE